MRKTRIFIFCFVIISVLAFSYNFAQTEYQEVITPEGKVITGLSKNEAIEKFGLPGSAVNEFWHYDNPDFFVYFPALDILNIYLYPEFCEVSPGFPLGYRVFADTSDFGILNITPQVKLIVDQPQNFIFPKPGTIIPKQPGDYKILATYKNNFSNTLYLRVRESSKDSREEEQLLSINILPHKPKLTITHKLNFIALGTFFKKKENSYTVREISDRVAWFTQQEGRTIAEPNRNISFPSPGTFWVFARFRDVKSYPQEVKVKEEGFEMNMKLRDITILPELVVIPDKQQLTLTAFGTYGNMVDDITAKVNWKIQDKELLASQGKGEFLLKSIGQTEVSAGLDNLESASAKIVIVETEGEGWVSQNELPSEEEKEEEKLAKQDLAKNIKNAVEKIGVSLIKEEKKLTLIKIIPEKLKINLGESEKLVAKGIFSDGSEEDITILGKWISLNSKVAVVRSGKVSSVNTGETKIYIKFLEVESAPASIIIEGAKLTSIILSPQNIETSMRDKQNIKAEGYFSDNSHKDITSLVAWEIINQRILKIKKGLIIPLRFGVTKVNAEYSGIKSLPIDVKVIFTLLWLVEKILIAISFILLIATALFFILYLVTERKKHQVLSLYKSPQEFIIALYDNLRKILIILGVKYQAAIIPLSYAELVEKKYSMKNKLLFKFTEKFEEARYSKHIFGLEDSNLAMHNYNNILDILMSNYNKFSLFIIFCLSLFYRRPLFISKGLRLDDKK